MIRLLFLLVLLALLSLGASWLADHPGSVTIYWLDWRIDTSFAFLAASILIAVIALWLVLAILGAVLRAPKTYLRWRQSRHYAQGLQSVTEGVAALVLADVPLAVEHTKKAQTLLGSQPITLLMQAQIARLKGDEERMVDLLESMLKHPETEFLAARSLSDAALKSRSASLALTYAQKATDIQPADHQAAVSLTGILLELGKYEEAQQAISRGQRKRALSRAQAKRLSAIVYAQQGAKLLDAGDGALALEAARQAWRRDRHFVPFVELMGRAYSKIGDDDAAYHLIRQTWKTHPHPYLLALFFKTQADAAPEAMLKKAEKLAAVRKSHFLSHLLIARANFIARKWQEARKAGKESLAVRESIPAMKLMSEIENAEYGDFDAAHLWLTRASEAPAEPMWQCSHCNSTHSLWSPLCPSCGSVDSLVMQPPYNQSGPEPEPVFTVEEPGTTPSVIG